MIYGAFNNDITCKTCIVDSILSISITAALYYKNMDYFCELTLPSEDINQPNHFIVIFYRLTM